MRQGSASALSGAVDGDASLFLPALLYLFVPSALVLLYFSKWPALVLVASVLAAIWLYPKSGVNREQLRALLSNTWPYLVLAAGIVWLSGALPPFAENTDWRKHYAIFNALASQSWPPKFIAGDGIATLRYSLGYYVVPALAVKCLGEGMLSLAIFVWSTLGCYLALVLAFGTGARAKLQCFLVGLVLLFFSGADIVGTCLTGAFPSPPAPFLHFEWWGGFGELPSSVTSIFWTPQHLISGWVAAFLFIRHPMQAVRNAGLIVGAAAIWSPFIAIGLIPTFIWAVLVTDFRELFTKLNIVVAPVLLLLAAMFLGNGAESIPFALIWHGSGFSLGNWTWFVFLEFIFIAAALMLLNPAARTIIVIHGAFLLMLCFFRGGALNDFLMRTSIPSLGVFAVVTANSLVGMPNGARKLPILILFLAGLATPLSEIWRGMVSPRIKEANKISLLNILDENRNLNAQYLVPSNEQIKLLPPILSTKDLKFTPFGNAEFDFNANRVSSDTYADAALVSQPLVLPVGYYRLDATLDWNIIPKDAGTNGGHVSVHAIKMLVPLMASEAADKSVSGYFYSDGKPLHISFGLGGWSAGKGFVALKKMEIRPVQAP